MITIIVNVEVVPEHIQEFIEATKKSQEATLKEVGCKKYEILHSFIGNNPYKNRFILIEEYVSEDAINAHKETLHFQEWRNTVNPITQRTSSKNITL